MVGVVVVEGSGGRVTDVVGAVVVGVVVGVGGAAVDDVSGSSLLAGSKTHSSEKETSSSATSPL